jgi:ribonuclease VapC
MVIDTSAVVAILFDEPDQNLYDEAIERAPVRLISAVTRVELSFVVEGRKGEAGRERLERFLVMTGSEIVAVTPQQAEVAIHAFRRFGKGRHRAALNIGDCFSYALAVATEHPLLFKGDDFIHTDVYPALAAEVRSQ